MDESIKQIKYLNCSPKYRVAYESLSKVIQMTKDSDLPVSQERPKIFMHGEKLNQLLSMNEDLITAGRPVMAKVFDCFTDKTKLLFLCDREGYVIDFVSSPEVVQWSITRGIMLGACLDYYSFGTNSISMAIHEKAPVVIIGDEHYCEALKTWSCIAAPIKCAGEITGFINISSNVNSDLIKLTALVELMAELIGERIQNKTKEAYAQWGRVSYEEKKMEGDVSDHVGDDCNICSDNTRIDRAHFYGKIIVTDAEITIRELEVLYGLFLGQDPDELARGLNISKNTIRSHIKNIYHKLGVSSSTECLKRVKGIIAE